MIKSDSQPTCKESNVNRFGYSALFDTTEDADIGEGVILSTTIMGEIYLFQLSEDINIFSKSEVEYIPGSEIGYLEDSPGHIPIDYIPISSVRYPTKSELDWYNKQDLV